MKNPTSLLAIVQKLYNHNNHLVLVVEQEERPVELGSKEGLTYIATRELLGILSGRSLLHESLLYIPAKEYVQSCQRSSWSIKQGSMVTAEVFLPFYNAMLTARTTPKSADSPLQRSLKVLINDEIQHYFGANQSRYLRALDHLDKKC